MAERVPVSAILLGSFERKALKLMDEEEMQSVADVVSYDPEAGDVMKGTGGVRKLRIPLEGRGKSGGARVVYYFHSDEIPLFLLTIFGKSEKSNLSKAERNGLKKRVKLLVAAYLD